MKYRVCRDDFITKLINKRAGQGQRLDSRESNIKEYNTIHFDNFSCKATYLLLQVSVF